MQSCTLLAAWESGTKRSWYDSVRFVYCSRSMDALQLARARSLSRTGAGRRVREAAGLTRAEVGRSIGASGAAVSRWEDGTRVPTGTPAIRYLRLIERLAAMTGTSLDEQVTA
jgi:DNA-binding transcriptional regulator YiaG